MKATVGYLAACARWTAEYGVTAPEGTPGFTSWAMWQVSETGSVPGLGSPIDTNVFACTQADLEGLYQSLA